MSDKVRWNLVALGGLSLGLTASVLFLAVPTSGWLTGLAFLAGAIAYAMMAANLFLAIRRPVLEKLLGPLDRVYVAHRVIGTGLVGVLLLHLVITPIASAVEHGENVLNSLGVAAVLGALGTLLLLASIALSINTKVPYDRWLRVHLATGAAFLVWTAYILIAASRWLSLTTPLGCLLILFALLGLASLAVRVWDRARGGIPYTVVETLGRERGREIVLHPDGARRITRHRPGQFMFLTANAETHPFTLTSAAGADDLRVLIRPSGDWSRHAQTRLTVGDRVRVDGPFGAFTPSVNAGTAAPQVWIAGGAGITPFLSALRSANGMQQGQVELVVAARDATDVPCWEELSTSAATKPWLTLTPTFSALGGRLDSEAVSRLVARQPEDAEWYLCGPAGLTDIVVRALDRLPAARVHRELYEWRTPMRSR
ncbi:ferric reductase-like transmembrane domain-containing protein [Amycolatopsis sp. NPDC006125]|uniref:ferric reductase-like transmembrane domain-containing protein n=1 Tax=Amycolatopsis sp. NPDC006125 TaxID=3156730 RepID=UPI0033BBE1AC